MLDILRKRRSVRQYDASRPIEAVKINLIIEAALRAPSSRGRNPWEFIVVNEPELLVGLGRAKEHGSAFLANVPLAVVVAADPDKCDVWVEDCAIAAIIMQLTATELGLGSCWVQIRKRPHDASRSAEDYIRELLDIPDNLAIDCVIGIGYPVKEQGGHPRSSLLDAQVHYNRFSK